MSLPDPSSFDRFAVVAFGTPEVVEAVEQIRRALPPSGRPILGAHVTVKGTFVDPTDLDQIAERVRATCAASRPFTLTTSEIHIWSDEAGSGVLFEIEESPELTRLHWQLVEQVKELATTIYYGEDIGSYRPHLTVVQQIPHADADAAVPMIERLSAGFTFLVTKTALVGRRGGTAWETIATFPIGSL
ncbi:MAG TPA: 2'-5' RNA ligase family protein [Chloroflexota bacterium]|nr:2'-5' RNA ligase family protein [Chloroflexota bacterium]